MNGKKEGKGRYTFRDGSKYEGDFVQGERNGHGVHYKITGSRFEGSFEKGKPIQGIKYYKNGSVKVIK